MDALNQRQKNILYHVINTYLATMQPIGSRTLTMKKGLGCSAATIRNEMYDLEKLGFLTHPHVSSGRIPTDKGYRYYVDYLIQQEEISNDIADKVRYEFKQKIEHIEELIEKTSHIVATISHEICIAVLLKPHSFCFKQVNLVKLDATRVLVLWITTSGLVKNDIIEFETIDEKYLKYIANFLNTELTGMPLEEIEAFILDKLSQERDSLYKVYTWANAIVQQTLAKNQITGSLFLDGRNYLLEKPEFQDIAQSKRLFEILDDKKELFDLFKSTYQTSPDCTVYIGKENHSHDFWNCSLISASFKLRNQAIGSINILGPKRIRYRSGISLLNYITHHINNTINRFEM